MLDDRPAERSCPRPRGAAKAGPAQAPAARPPAAGPHVSTSGTRGETRERLREVLDQYPPSVGQVLRLDPSLLSKPDYLAPYPTLAGLHRAASAKSRTTRSFFLGDPRFDVPGDRQGARACSVVRERVRRLAMFLIGVVSFVTLSAGCGRAVIDYRRWLRASKIQTDAHAKDRRSADVERRPAGLHAVAGGPAVSAMSATSPSDRDVAMRAVGRAGQPHPLVGAGRHRPRAGGVGFWFAKNERHRRSRRSRSTWSRSWRSRSASGSSLSALVSYVLSRQLGLLEREPRSTHA